MPTKLKESRSRTHHRVRIGLQLILGIALIVYGIGLFTGTFTWTPPAIVYFAVGISLGTYGVWKATQQ